MEGPLVSVILPVHNGSPFLLEAVASLRRGGIASLEILVSDDGSTDDGIERLGRLKEELTLVRGPRKGPAAARNRAMAVARGKFLAFCDADDLWIPGQHGKSLARLMGDPSLSVVMGHSQLLESRDCTDARSSVAFLWSLGASIIRRELFDELGTFDETLAFSEDLDWFLRVREAGKSILLRPEALQRCRRHGGNMTLGRSPVELAIPQVLHRSLQRRARKGMELAPVLREEEPSEKGALSHDRASRQRRGSRP